MSPDIALSAAGLSCFFLQADANIIVDINIAATVSFFIIVMPRATNGPDGGYRV
jgi:hypothetical protein